MDTRETDRFIDDARASLVARIEELGRRFQDARHKLDVAAHIESHPLIATLVAFGLGAMVGLAQGRKRAEPTSAPGVGSVAVTVLSAIGVRLAKDVATRYLAQAARAWFDGRMERASRDPSVEPFLAH